MRIDGKHFIGKHIRAIGIRIILKQIQDKPGVPVDNRPVQRRTPPAVGQITAASVEAENTVCKPIQHGLGNQPLPAHGNTDFKFIPIKEPGRFFILQSIGMGFEYRDSILFR